jgi:peptidoglycan/xylan/chitin deacetylase (PgdA/CDA1 family)
MRETLRKTAARARRSRLAFRLNQHRLRDAARRNADGTIRAVTTNDRVVALSYDDGPSPANTTALLEILAAANARATFFVVGSRVEQHAEIVVRTLSQGHELGNHSHTHPNLRSLATDEALREIETAAAAIESVAGPTSLFRPPFGKSPSHHAEVLARLGLETVMWSIDSGDTMPFSARRIAREVIRRVQPGDIVLLHDGGDRRDRTLEATTRILDTLGSRGYRFVTVSELLALDR